MSPDIARCPLGGSSRTPCPWPLLSPLPLENHCPRCRPPHFQSAEHICKDTYRPWVCSRNKALPTSGDFHSGPGVSRHFLKRLESEYFSLHGPRGNLRKLYRCLYNHVKCDPLKTSKTFLESESQYAGCVFCELYEYLHMTMLPANIR